MRVGTTPSCPGECLDPLNNIWVLSSWDARAGAACPEHAYSRQTLERMPRSGWRGVCAVLDALEETIRPWQEAPWDFSIPPTGPKAPGCQFSLHEAVGRVRAGWLRALLPDPLPCCPASGKHWSRLMPLPHALPSLAINNFSLPNPFSSAVRSVPQHPSSSCHLPPAMAAPLPCPPLHHPSTFPPRREQRADGFLCLELWEASIHLAPTAVPLFSAAGR